MNISSILYILIRKYRVHGVIHCEVRINLDHIDLVTLLQDKADKYKDSNRNLQLYDVLSQEIGIGQNSVLRAFQKGERNIHFKLIF